MKPRLIFMTTGTMPRPAPALEALPTHPAVSGARMLPDDGRFTIDGAEWRIEGARAVALDELRRPVLVDHVGPRVCIFGPPRFSPGRTFSVGLAPRSVIEEADELPIVITGFGVARWGEA